MAKLFNLNRFKKLLELEEKNKIDFLDIELLSYKASIKSQSLYNRKEDYFSLIEQYLKGDLSSSEFRSKFQKMEQEDLEIAFQIREDFQRLETLTLAENLEEFAKFENSISNLCFDYDEIWDGTLVPMSESEFYSLVNSRYFQLQRFFPALSSTNLPYEKLISRSFQILAGITGLGIALIFFNI